MGLGEPQRMVTDRRYRYGDPKIAVSILAGMVSCQSKSKRENQTMAEADLPTSQFLVQMGSPFREIENGRVYW